jgi:anaerobic magnesium-protoporphyrin IX monomethyl ester cyclase
MKIALVFPNLNGSPQTLDLGIAYLATYIKERTSHEIRVIDVTFHTRHWKAHVRRQIEEFKPDVIGFSVLSVLWDHCIGIMREIRSYHSVPHIVGGYQAILAPEETIAQPEVDAICTGEGEITLSEYLDVLQNKGSLREVRGLWYKEGGSIIRNPFREAITDLDSLPFPDWDVFDDIEKYLFFLGRLYALGTRGCPYRCTFCAETSLENIFSGKRWRERSPENYVAEIAHQYEKFKDRGMVGAHLFDTVFSFNNKWLERWVAEYKRRGLDTKLPFTVFARPDKHNMAKEKIKLLAEAGCAQMRMGIESGNDVIRKDELRKPGCTNDGIVAITQALNHHGILAKTYSIIGFPHDTKESIRRTIQFADNPLVQTQFVLSYTPIQGTPMAMKMKDGMNTSGSTRVYSFHFSGGVRNPNYGRWYVDLMLIWCYLYFGTKQAWLSFVASPLNFLRVVPSRIFMGFVWGNPLLLTTLYGIIHASFWPGWKRVQKRRWRRLYESAYLQQVAVPESRPAGLAEVRSSC